MADTSPKSFIPAVAEYGVLKNTTINTNLALNTNFRFVLKKIPTVTYFITSVTTPQSSSEPLSYDFVTAAPYKFPGGSASTDLSLRFIIDEDFTNYIEMYRWFRSGLPYKDLKNLVPEKEVGPSDGVMYLLNNKKNPMRMITYRNLILTQLSGFTLSHTESEPSVLTALATFVFDSFTVTQL